MRAKDTTRENETKCRHVCDYSKIYLAKSIMNLLNVKLYRCITIIMKRMIINVSNQKFTTQLTYQDLLTSYKERITNLIYATVRNVRAKLSKMSINLVIADINVVSINKVIVYTVNLCKTSCWTKTSKLIFSMKIRMQAANDMVQ